MGWQIMGTSARPSATGSALMTCVQQGGQAGEMGAYLGGAVLASMPGNFSGVALELKTQRQEDILGSEGGGGGAVIDNARAGEAEASVCIMHTQSASLRAASIAAMPQCLTLATHGCAQ